MTGLRIDIVTLFPSLLACWLEQGVVSRAVERDIVAIEAVDLRARGVGRHQITDDYPFGGGPGMVLKPEPLFDAVESLDLAPSTPVILLSPRGRTFNQGLAERLAAEDRFVLVAGHYEGVDQRFIDALVTEEISLGDYVLSSGELGAMVVADAVTRLLPGAIASGASEEESFADGLLEYPQYTRPASYRGMDVPPVLLSGHHGQVASWRRRQSLAVTLDRRPDLLENAALSEEDREVVEELRASQF
jgi:tRNA (guanine37-N1)-methyltransferase